MTYDLLPPEMPDLPPVLELTQQEQAVASFAMSEHGIALEPCEIRAMAGMLDGSTPPDPTDADLRFSIVNASFRETSGAFGYAARHSELQTIFQGLKKHRSGEEPV